MKEFRHFVGVSVEVILVEYEDSLERIKGSNAQRNEESIPGRAPRPGSTRCPFLASAHPKDMQGPQPPRFQSLFGGKLRDFPICQKGFNQLRLSLFTDSRTPLCHGQLRLSALSVNGGVPAESVETNGEHFAVFGPTNTNHFRSRRFKGVDRIDHNRFRQYPHLLCTCYESANLRMPLKCLQNSTELFSEEWMWMDVMYISFHG